MIRMSSHRGDIPGKYFYPLSVASYGEDEVQAVIDHLTTYRTTMAETTRHFEEEFASYVGTKYAVMTNSGSSADLLIAFALISMPHPLLSRGDTVLVPAVTWPTHVWSLMMAGLRVQLVNVDPATLNIDCEALEVQVREARAISVVHLMGNPCDMAKVVDIADTYHCTLLEDCCEALGATYGGRHVGTFGLASAFSFFFSHQMTTFEGGMVCTDDVKLAKLLRLLRSHGWDHTLPGYVFTTWGFNVRPTEMAAAVGLVQLRKLEAMNDHRRDNYDIFAKRLPGVVVPMPRTASPFAVPLMVDNRDHVVKHLEMYGVETRPIVAGNLARQPVGAQLGLHGWLPGANEVHDRGLVVGLHPHRDWGTITKVCDLIEEVTT